MDKRTYRLPALHHSLYVQIVRTAMNVDSDLRMSIISSLTFTLPPTFVNAELSASLTTVSSPAFLNTPRAAGEFASAVRSSDESMAPPAITPTADLL